MGTELCYYIILISGSISEVAIRVISTQNIALTFAKQTSTEALSDVTTLTTGQTLKKTVATNDRFILIATPTSSTAGTLSFDLKEEKKTSETASEAATTKENQNLLFLATNITIFILLAVIGIILCFVLKYIDKKFPYKEPVPEPEVQDDAKADLESEHPGSKKDISKPDNEDVGIMESEEVKEPKIDQKPKLSTFARQSNNPHIKRHFKKLSSRKVMVYHNKEAVTDRSISNKRLSTQQAKNDNDSVRLDSHNTVKLNSARDVNTSNSQLDISREISREYSNNFAREVPQHIMSSFRKFMK